MTSQKQRLIHTQTAKKKATNVTQDASAFEPVVEPDKETLDQVTGGTTYTGSNPPTNPKQGDSWKPKAKPGMGYAGGPGTFVYGTNEVGGQNRWIRTSAY